MRAHYSARIENLSEAATVAVSDKARQLKRAGVDVIDMGGGDPDFTTPAHIIEAAYRAMQGGHTHYVGSKGLPELREAIASKLARDNGLKYDPDSEVVVTTGARMGIYATLCSLCNPGDEVVILEPAWVSYKPLVQLAGGTAVVVGLDVADNYRITEALLRPYLTPKTRALIVNSPNNPIGRVLARDEWQAIAAAVGDSDIVVISDEVYEKLIYCGRPNISAATVPGLESQVVTVNGFSKSFAMCGWRLGYVAGDKRLMALVGKVQQQVSTCAPSFGQHGAVAALNGPQDVVEQMRRVYEARRNELVPALCQIPGVECLNPEGAFYCFVHFKDVKMPAAKLADFMLDEVALACVPGSAFGDAGEGCLRMTFAASEDSLRQVPERVARALRKLG